MDCRRVDLQTIETLQPIACTISPAQMTTDNLASSFPSLSVAQQQIDLWTIFQSPNFKDGTPYGRSFGKLLFHFQTFPVDPEHVPGARRLKVARDW